ncbi:hypothetical protein ADL26_13370, partial [Thermoactinomyces vulgaris]
SRHRRPCRRTFPGPGLPRLRGRPHPSPPRHRWSSRPLPARTGRQQARHRHGRSGARPGTRRRARLPPRGSWSSDAVLDRIVQQLHGPAWDRVEPAGHVLHVRVVLTHGDRDAAVTWPLGVPHVLDDDQCRPGDPRGEDRVPGPVGDAEPPPCVDA